MIHRFAPAMIFGLLVTSPVVAQTAQPAEKPETSCTTAPGSTTGQAPSPSSDSMAVEKSAILPSAGGHANSAATTVQKDGKPMQVRTDCPPDSQAK